MQLNTIQTIPFLFFNNLVSHPGLFHTVTTREGGQSTFPYHSLNLGFNTDDNHQNVLANHLLVCKALNLDPSGMVSVTQIHKDHLLVLKKNEPGAPPGKAGSFYQGYDAIISNRPGITLFIKVADCVPLILFDPGLKVVAVIHAGWKGMLLNIVPKTIKRMKSEFGCFPGDLIAGIGPSIGRCCFSVNDAISQQFRFLTKKSHLFIEHLQGIPHIDLKIAGKLQLTRCGVNENKIEISESCTSCRSDIFFSHRREKGRTGRFALLAGLSRSGT